MLRPALYRAFRGVSSLLRRTPLRRSSWIAGFHSEVFRLLRPAGPVTVGPLTLHVDARDCVIAKKLTLYGSYEAFELELLPQLLRAGDTFVDIGANIGLYALWASRFVGPTGQVIALEPDPDNYALLIRNVAINRAHNIEALNQAASNSSGPAVLYQSRDNRGMLSLRDVTHSRVSVPVMATTLDEYLAGRGERIALIKLDIEGAEPLALEGMKKILSHNRGAALLMEFAPELIEAFGRSPAAFLEELLDLGFRFSRVDEGARRLVPNSREEILAFTTTVESSANILCRRITAPAFRRRDGLPHGW